MCGQSLHCAFELRLHGNRSCVEQLPHKDDTRRDSRTECVCVGVGGMELLKMSLKQLVHFTSKNILLTDGVPSALIVFPRHAPVGGSSASRCPV